MGQEFCGRGVNVALGLRRCRWTKLGRFWCRFLITGISAAQTVKDIWYAGVIACAKPFISNEQEHFRGGSLASKAESSDIDDKTMHELYLWPFSESVQAGRCCQYSVRLFPFSFVFNQLCLISEF